MDERKNTIKELEEKKRTLSELRSRLFEGLGEALIQRIGEEEPFLENTGDKPGGILTDYRKLQNEISESNEKIKVLEADAQKLKDIEVEISEKESEKFQLSKELEDVNVRLGKALLADPEFEEIAGTYSAQEENFLAKIEEQELKLEELEEKEGGIFAWLGKNAQMAVSRTLLSKYRTSLKRVYHSAGEKLLLSEQGESLDKDLAAEAYRLCEVLSTLNESLANLKNERRQIGESFGSDGTPARRINGLEKHIAHIKGEFPAVYLRMGSLASEDDGRKALSSFLNEEDQDILDKAEHHRVQIIESESQIKKIKVEISIDKEKAEVEKIRKSILNQKQKITSAESQILDYENQIVECNERIEELEMQIKGGIGTKVVKKK